MAKPFKLVGASAINILARLAANKAIKEKLRGDGVRLTLVPPREIAEQAQRYLVEHPELYREALERAKRMGWIEPKAILVTAYGVVQAALYHRQVAPNRPLKRLNFLVQLLRFSVARAY